MTLPDFLTADDFGDINLAGHRVGLFHVVEHYRAHPSIEGLCEEFPSVDPALLRQVIKFCEENKTEVDAYVDHYRSDLDRQEAAHQSSAALLEMRRRLSEKDGVQDKSILESA